MNVIICVKTVKTSLVMSDQYEDPLMVNPYDLYALDSLLEWKARAEEAVHITCLSMGPIHAKQALIKCLAMGCDEAVLLCDKEFSGADTVATTYVLSKAIEGMGSYDLIVCGAQAVDGETGQVCYGLAERLKLECVSDTEKVIEQRKDRILLSCHDAEYEHTVEAVMPVMLCCRDFLLSCHRLSLSGFKRAKRKGITVMDASVLGVDRKRCGAAGSKTRVAGTAAAETQKESLQVTGSVKEQAALIRNVVLQKQTYMGKGEF